MFQVYPKVTFTDLGYFDALHLLPHRIDNGEL